MEASSEVVAQQSVKVAVHLLDAVPRCQGHLVEVVPSVDPAVPRTQVVQMDLCPRSDQYQVLADVVLQVAEAHLVLPEKSVILLLQAQFS